MPHALFVPSDDGSTRGVIDENLARLGVRRRVAATFAHIVGEAVGDMERKDAV